VRQALRQVMDPELGLNVVELGLIRQIDLDSTPAQVKMILTTPFCPMAPYIMEQVKAAAQKAVGGEVKVELLTEQWHPDLMEDPAKLGF
jgi:metal-sulfur cluster biosynthetic enzyme